MNLPNSPRFEFFAPSLGLFQPLPAIDCPSISTKEDLHNPAMVAKRRDVGSMNLTELKKRV